MAESASVRSLLELKHPHLVAAYATYEGAQRAVDFLADRSFEVQNLCIVGSDLKLLERVTGRRTWGTVLSQGVVSGIGTGLLVGLMLALFTPDQSLGMMLLVGLGLGIMLGLVTAGLGYAMSGGKRDFNSVSQTVATKYELMAEHNVVEKARQMLMDEPGTRAAMFS